MKKKVLLIIIALFTSLAYAQKSKISVLYVGVNPDDPVQIVKKGYDSQEVFEENVHRWEDFGTFLNKNFIIVKLIHHVDYSAELSDKYDVTIFDACPKALKERVLERNEKGEVTNYEAAKYLPQDFSAAAITISDISAQIGEGLQLKLDWCCLCLDKYALLTNEDHAIFNTPNNVELIWEEKPTPEQFFNENKGFGETIKMWEVQTEGFERGSKVGSGLINRGDGYTDSPDAEVISGGKHTKYSNNVALGRHGNFFHWGFSGSPKYMTDQGKLVFLNVIHYIAQFKGQKPLSRKLDPAMWLQKTYKSKLKADYMKNYKQYAGAYEKMNQSVQEAKEKKAKGEKLNDEEEFYANQPEEEIPTLDYYMKMVEPVLYPEFGNDFKKYNDYYQKYFPYMKADPKSLRNFIVDEDAMKFGMSFNDPDFLETCLKALKDPEKRELALKLLKRYTMESFETDIDWEQWYEENHKNLFYTETGGCKYIVNTNN